MAKHGQQQQDSPANDPASVSGGRQSVVEACEISSFGIIFWSRQRFDIGAEVQLRMLSSALVPTHLALVGAGEKWVMLKGLVVACPLQRRGDGSAGFQVTLLIEQANFEPMKLESKIPWIDSALPGHHCFGLN